MLGLQRRDRARLSRRTRHRRGGSARHPARSALYIPGYGYAIAGDTGGDIRGNRIDLGFNSERDAMMFGRRAITVYRIK